MWVGQYDGLQYPFYGNISHLAIVHCEADWSSATIEGITPPFSPPPLLIPSYPLDM